MRRKQLRALAMAALVAALLTLPLGFKVAASDDVITQAALTGAAINGVRPHGVAEFRLRADGRRSFKVEAEDVNLPVNTRLDVAVDGRIAP